MVIPSSGALSFDNVQTEFGGSNPISLTEYYGLENGVPTSGTISLSNFRGKRRKGKLAAIGHIRDASIASPAKPSYISSITQPNSGEFRYNYTNTLSAENNPVIHAGSDNRQSGFGGGDRTLWFYVYSYFQTSTYTQARFRYMRDATGRDWGINHCSMLSYCHFV
jgi:hypothetical protein